MATYTARNLDDIAALFERHSEQAARNGTTATTQKARALANRESRTWQQAADILRATTIA